MAFVGQYSGDPRIIAMQLHRLNTGQKVYGSQGQQMASDLQSARQGMGLAGGMGGSAAFPQGLYQQAIQTGSGLLQDPESITDAMQQQMIARAQSGIQQQYGEQGRQLQRAFAQRGISGAARQRLEQDMAAKRTAALTGAEQDVIRKRAMQRGADIRSGLSAIMPLLQLGQSGYQFSASRPQPTQTFGQPEGRSWGFGPSGGLGGAFQQAFLGGFQQAPPQTTAPQFTQPASAIPSALRKKYAAPQKKYAFPPGISPTGAF